MPEGGKGRWGRKIQGFVTMAALSLLPVPALGTESFTTLSEDGAWCWFQDPRAVYHKGAHERLYVGWVNSKGDIEVASYDLATKETVKSVLHEKLNKDDHANPGILIRPDGRLMVFYTAHSHAKVPMYYRVSEQPEDVRSWGEERAIRANSQGGRGWCYPNPVQLEAEQNRIYLFWRGANWKPNFSVSDNGVDWSEARTLVQEEGREASSIRPYTKVFSNGKEAIHFAFTDGHPRDEPRNSIYYLCYRGGAFYKADETKVGIMEQLPLRHSAADIVYDGRKTGVRSWVWDLAADGDGRPVVVYTRLPAETDHRYHYARWDGMVWQDHEICAAGKWFPLTPAGKKEPEPHYSGGVVLDSADPDTVYLSRPVDGVMEIERWTTGNLGRTWSHEVVTAGSKSDQIRPYVARFSPPGLPSRLVWMDNQGAYVHYTNYHSAIRLK